MPTRRSFTWPDSEKKPRFFSQTCCGTSHGRVHPSCACVLRLCCSALRALQHNPGPLRKFEPGEKWQVPQHAAAAHSPLPGLQCWQVVEFKTTRTLTPTAQVVNASQVRVPAHSNHRSCPDINPDHRRWRCCSPAMLSCLARRAISIQDLVASGRWAGTEQLRQCGRQRAAEARAQRAREHGCVCRVWRVVCLVGTFGRSADCGGWKFHPPSTFPTSPTRVGAPGLFWALRASVWRT